MKKKVFLFIFLLCLMLVGCEKSFQLKLNDEGRIDGDKIYINVCIDANSYSFINSFEVPSSYRWELHRSKECMPESNIVSKTANLYGNPAVFYALFINNKDENDIHLYTIEVIRECDYDYSSGVIVRNPTCAESGQKKYLCKRNNEHVKYETIPATGKHIGGTPVSKDSTCSEFGYKDRIYCSMCDLLMNEGERIEYKEHTAVSMKEVAPTCSKTGLAGGKYCSECNKILSSQYTVPKIEHDYENYICKDCNFHYYTNGLIFKLNSNGKYIVYDYEGSANEIVIPSIYQGKEVVAINASTFKDCSSITSVVIPSSVTSIGSEAFYNCDNLTSITIPFVGAELNGTSNIHFGYIFGASSYSENSSYVPTSLKEVIITGGTSIGERAFCDCANLTNIVIPSSVTIIGWGAFFDCANLTNIVIPSSVTSIEDSAFKYCSSLESIIVDKDNKVYDSRNNCNAIIETSTNTLILGCQNTKIPNSVTSIGYSAFIYCSNLTSVVIPNTVTAIGSCAFMGCSSLTKIEIPNSVVSIEPLTFWGCSSLTSIIIPNSVTNIDRQAFWGCSSLTSIEIPSSVTSIEIYAFEDCSSLTSIVIPESVTSIGYAAFDGCSNLKTVYYQGTSSDWSKISIGTSNTALTSAKRYYYSETQPTRLGNYWHYDSEGNVVVW